MHLAVIALWLCLFIGVYLAEIEGVKNRVELELEKKIEEAKKKYKRKPRDEEEAKKKKKTEQPH